MDILTNTNFGLFLLIVAPGFLSLKIWGLIQPHRHVTFADSLYEAIFYGVINYFLVVSWLPPLIANYHIVFYILSYIFSLVIVPILLPIIWRLFLKIPFLKNKIIHPTPKSWDYFFGKRKPCLMLIHLKNGNSIGGLYSGDSFASSYPEKEDFYLEQVWELSETGKFLKPIDNTMGLLINYDTVDYVELFNIVLQGE